MPSLHAPLGRAFRRYFVTGLATLFPVAVTIFIVAKIVLFTDGFLGNLLGVQVPGLGLAATIVIILVVGVASVHFFGRVLFQVIEFWLGRLPFVSKIYPPVKQLAQFLFDEESRNASIRRVVLIQYPRPGVYSIAFVTNEAKTSAPGKPMTLLTCLIPNPPSPFTGPIMFVPIEDAVPLTMTVEDAVKFIVSGGVVAPPLEAAAPSKHA
jgi:uncharacterized membrane protein